MLLQNINMTIQSGEMVLILGGSGAGKTTFMNAVMGYEKAEGRIMHGDTDIYEDFESMKYKIGFVPQQDLIRTSDSVYDTLSNAAEMKMPKGTTKEERSARIEKVLETLGLQRERNSLVSKLSGGQKKRLSIAVEYIANPSLFFLDEPDSGLDGIMSKSLMQNLRNIADEGKIVMVISHAPDRASELFNKVVVLAKSVQDNCGHLAFFGSIQEAKDFFETDSLEGVVKRINRADEGGDGLSDYYIQKYSERMSK
jgi:ABC-type multidrug transport system ATPase subunit